MTPTHVKVSIENLAPESGLVLAQFWTAFHDGSFDLFDVGATASISLEYLAEDGLVGLEGMIPGLAEELIAAGLDLNKVPPISETIAGEFADSTAAANGGVQDIVFNLTTEPFPLGQLPGETITETIALNENVASNRFFSYASMIFPSNDGFIGNDNPIEIFDAEGNFLGADFIVFGNEVWDVGTEVNNEDPFYVPYTLVEFGNSITEDSTIAPHPGFLPAGSGGILDFELDGEPFFTNADFTVEGYQVARITVTEANVIDVPSNPILGTPQSDLLLGTAQGDAMEGFQSSDRLFGLAGDDLLDGGRGSDILAGGVGEDTLIGGQGRDVLIGGTDGDTFVLTADTAVVNAARADLILAFQVGIDAIALTGGLTEADLTLELVGNGSTAIAIAESDRILGIVTEVTPERLSGNFISLDLEM